MSNIPNVSKLSRVNKGADGAYLSASRMRRVAFSVVLLSNLYQIYYIDPI